MARISTANGADRYAVTVSGSLTAADLRSLERACGPAIERQRTLHITLGANCSLDASARAYIERLVARGAVVGTASTGEGPTHAVGRPSTSTAASPRGRVVDVRLRRLLCPVDYSDASRRALEHAAAMARWFDAALTVLHVVPPGIPGSSAGVPVEVPLPIVEPQDGAAASEALRVFAHEAIGGGESVTTRVAFGPVLDTVMDAATTEKSDLIVVGSHGRSGLERVFLGSLTERVMHHAACPVLVVPRRADRRASGGVLFDPIVCAVDFTASTVAAVDQALSLAAASDARLTLVHVLPALDDKPWVPASFRGQETRRMAEREAGRALADLLPAGAEQWCEPDTVVVTGKASQQILALADDRLADLIVMGVAGHTPFARAVMGSTTHRVVRDARCPVLTVPA